MAKKSIRIRATVKGDNLVEVKALMSHPMETGLRKDKKTGKKIPAHYIEDVVCEVGGKTVMVAHWGPAVSKNPYLAFRVRGAKKGDKVKISWTDNKGQSDSGETVVK